MHSIHTEILLTCCHGLKSARPYNFSTNIAETTHKQLRFCKYKTDPATGEQEREQSFEGIVSIEELFKTALDKGWIKPAE